jgi:hypothetical protein
MAPLILYHSTRSNGQNRAKAVFIPCQKAPKNNLTESYVGPRARLEGYGEKKNLVPLSEIEPTHTLVTIPTELHRIATDVRLQAKTRF